MKERLQRFFTAEGISPAKFADEIGVQRSSISHLLSGRNKPGYDFIYKFSLRYSNVNIDWLITGRGSMYKQKDTETLAQDSNHTVENQLNKETNQTQSDNKFTNVNNIDRVMIFYKDGTFTGYVPK